MENDTRYRGSTQQDLGEHRVDNSDMALQHDPKCGSDNPVRKKQGEPKAAIATAIFSPALITTLFLIFGGCCSNVYTLESILRLSPATGTLVTFLQFLLTSLYTLRSQLTIGKHETGIDTPHTTTALFPRFRKRLIPLYKWLIYTALFLTINMLNNAAFSYRISIPLHIILRSAGPVTSMLVGRFVGGRRYTVRQTIAVLLLFGGVVLAALSDAQAKSPARPNVSVESDFVQESEQSAKALLANIKLSEQMPGFVLLFSALLLSAIMGLYTDELYNAHGRSPEVTDENIFYSHTLSLPFFALQSRTLRTQYNTLLTNFSATSANHSKGSTTFPNPLPFQPVPALFPSFLYNMISSIRFETLPPLFLLIANALTQIICITGVHRLSTQTTSLTVSIVLNIRKLVSLLLSIWLFGNQLPIGVVVGAALVFSGGGLYGWKSKKKVQTRHNDRLDGSKKDS